MAGNKTYVRNFTDTATGKTYRGVMQGSGGTAVGVRSIQNGIRRVREGRDGAARFFEPTPEHVRVFLADGVEREFDDPEGWVDLPLATLAVEEIGE